MLKAIQAAVGSLRLVNAQPTGMLQPINIDAPGRTFVAKIERP
jgi:hypothetical protein